jgi:ketosteroid isomerase-like protein
VKLRWTIFSLVCMTVVLIIACQPASTNKDSGAATSSTNAPANASAAKPEGKVIAEELRALLAEHDKALSEKNLDTIMATFSTEPNTVVLGTGSEEKWQGQSEIRAAYTEMFKDYDPNTLDAKCDWKTGGASEAGTMAWLAAICDCKDSLAGKAREYKLNVTAAAEKQGGKWKFVSLHMSNAFQPPVTK